MNPLLYLFPYRYFIFHSTITADDAAQILSAEVVAKKYFRLGWSYSKPIIFEGKVSAEGFRVNRVVRGRGVSPIMRGRFVPNISGIDIQVSIQWPIVLLISLLINLCFIGIILSQLSVDFLGGLSHFLLPILVLEYIAVTVQFILEANKATAFFNGLFRPYEYLYFPTTN